MATGSSPKKATRRARGAPRLLLLEAARTLFARHDYRSTTTVQIAEKAGVAEHLLFRHFGSKARLFNEAVVVPFLTIIDDLNADWESFAPGPESAEAVAREFLGSLYDVFLENRGLVMTLWAADAMTDEELADTGIADIDRAIAVLGQLGGKGSTSSGSAPASTPSSPPGRRWPWSPAWPRSAPRSSAVSGHLAT